MKYRMQHRLYANLVSNTSMSMLTGTSGSWNNQLNSPYDIVLHPISNALYITDSGNHRIMCYPFGALNATVVAGGNGPGTGNTQL